jgi:hypothetical protein
MTHVMIPKMFPQVGNVMWVTFFTAFHPLLVQLELEMELGHLMVMLIVYPQLEAIV